MVKTVLALLPVATLIAAVVVYRVGSYDVARGLLAAFEVAK